MLPKEIPHKIYCLRLKNYNIKNCSREYISKRNPTIMIDKDRLFMNHDIKNTNPKAS